MTTENKKTYEAKIVIIDPGLPNLGIRISPAEHEYEKVDLTFNTGRDRWAVIQQTMSQFCPPGRAIPKPLSFNPNHPKETNTPAPPASEWPIIELVGTVLKAPPERERVRSAKPVDDRRELMDRIARLENLLMSKEAASTEPKQSEAPKRGRPPKQNVGA